VGYPTTELPTCRRTIYTNNPQNKLDCFNMVNIPLLSRPLNDDEENQGRRIINEIVDHTFTVHADFHQGNQSMFRSNAGKQCVAMSLCSIVYNEIKSVNIWDTSIMNQILVYGNNLYGVISQSINKDFLLLTDVSTRTC
jgi:hypothetical protein